MFYSCFHLSIPNYLRNFENFDKWLLYFKTIMKAPVENNPSNHRIVSRIYVKIITVYCNDSHDLKNMYKGWGQQFRERYGQNLYN